jgi:hypothetical protein
MSNEDRPPQVSKPATPTFQYPSLRLDSVAPVMMAKAGSDQRVRVASAAMTATRSGVVRGKWMGSIRCCLLSAAMTMLFASASHAEGCQSELRILADDLAGVKLTSAQSQQIADKVLQARRHCWVQHEQTAMKLINSARRTAGLKESSGEFDWEHVPLEQLEKPPSDN